jgi:hypothetical protein
MYTICVCARVCACAVCCVLCAVCCVLCAVLCVLCVCVCAVCCVPCAVCCVLCAVCCVLCAVCCVLCAVLCAVLCVCVCVCVCCKECARALLTPRSFFFSPPFQHPPFQHFDEGTPESSRRGRGQQTGSSGRRLRRSALMCTQWKVTSGHSGWCSSKYLGWATSLTRGESWRWTFGLFFLVGTALRLTRHGRPRSPR